MTQTNNNKTVCARLTTLISIDHAADSRADVGGGRCSDRDSVLCPWTDTDHIGLWKQKNTNTWSQHTHMHTQD